MHLCVICCLSRECTLGINSYLSVILNFLQSEISNSNKGHKMLEKMGWKKGEGLGKDGSGMKDPVGLSHFYLKKKGVEMYLQ